MINQDKPTGGQGFQLNIGGGFNLLIGGVYNLLVGFGGANMINSSKVSVGETWASVTTTWASETRTWLAVSQLLTNSARTSSSITNQAKP